jgi:hypothetical protein
MVVRRKYIQVFTSGVIVVIANTTITLDAAVHFMVNEWSQVLIGERSFFIMIAAVIVARHDGHILQMATPAFIANGAIVRVIGHKPFYNLAAKRFGGFVGHRYPQTVFYIFHATHHQFAMGIVLIFKHLHRALTAGAHTAQGGMPAEIWQIDT